MPFVLIKNNLKLMLRNKWILVTIIMLPIVFIALLSSAFEGMLSDGFEIKEFQVGYRIEEESPFKPLFKEWEKESPDSKIEFVSYPGGDIEKLLQEGTVKVFVSVEEKEYTIYKNQRDRVEAAIVESIFSSVFQGIQGEGVKNEAVKAEKLPINPKVNSMDYYGIIEIAYMLWCGMISLAAVIGSERKNKIAGRVRVTPISGIKIYLGKLIPCAAAVMIEIGIAAVASSLLFDIHWGNLFWSGVILILMSLNASAMGIVLFEFFDNIAVAVVIGWILLFIWGFLGGTFQTYMYSTIPDSIVRLSPQYYINRTLVEFSTMGRSDVAGTCLIMLIIMFIVFSGFGLLVVNRRKEGR